MIKKYFRPNQGYLPSEGSTVVSVPDEAQAEFNIESSDRRELAMALYSIFSIDGQELPPGKEVQLLLLLGYLGANIDTENALSFEEEYNEKYIEHAKNLLATLATKESKEEYKLGHWDKRYDWAENPDKIIRWGLPRNRLVLLSCLKHFYTGDQYNFGAKNPEILSLIEDLGGSLRYDPKQREMEIVAESKPLNAEAIDRSWTFVSDMMKAENKAAYNLGNWESEVLERIK